MNKIISICSLSLLLLFNFTGAKPVSDLQSFKQLVEAAGNSAPHRPLNEMQVEGKDGHAESVSGAEDLHPWDSPSNWALAAEENVLSRFLKDLMWTSKRRYKKGGLRSCFGVRLERIGSFSGLGC